MDKLCGTLFVYDGCKYDYCFKEAIRCLLDFCDYVVIVAGGNDGTFTECLFTFSKYADKIEIIRISKEEWESQHGKEKLNYFTNIAIQRADKLGFQYNFNLQADEIVHENSYEAIRQAVQQNEEGYICNRINLWQSPYLQLDVPQNRMPCSSNIVRLAKINYRSYGDAESLAVNNINIEFTNRISIYHMGFVRKRDIMKDKVVHMQEQVFGIDHDKKLDGSDVFIPERWFSKEELKPIDEPLPKLIQKWANERIYE